MGLRPTLKVYVNRRSRIMAKQNRSTGRYLHSVELDQVKHAYKDKLTSQFLYHYFKYKDNQVEFKYGDEIEYTLVSFDEERKCSKALLKGDRVVAAIDKNTQITNGKSVGIFYEELPRFQVESVPRRPFIENELHLLEQNLIKRRSLLQEHLFENESPMTIGIFPRLGCHGYTKPNINVGFTEGSKQSALYPEAVYSSHSKRIKSIGKSLYHGKKGCLGINIPVFEDINTTLSNTSIKDHCMVQPLTGHVYLDSTLYTAALQITVQVNQFSSVRMLHDNMIALCPILLALSAASPIIKGYLVDTDTRWVAAGLGTDDNIPLENSNYEDFYIRSRFSKIPDYIAPGSSEFNDLYNSKDFKIYDRLRNSGVDKSIANYFTNIFTLNPLYLVDHDLNSEESDTCLIQNCQSTTWGAVRAKIPLHSEEGWRLEFRVCEVQPTDFQNAAFTAFVVLFSKITELHDIDLRIPLSKVEENIVQANERNAALNGKFWFDVSMESNKKGRLNIVKDLLEPLKEKKSTINNIMNGEKGGFCGFIPLMRKYVESSATYSEFATDKIFEYLDYISDISTGKRVTTSTWMREFVTSHAKYERDSVVSDEIQYDLLTEYDRIAQSNTWY